MDRNIRRAGAFFQSAFDVTYITVESTIETDSSRWFCFHVEYAVSCFWLPCVWGELIILEALLLSK